jgi:hypothetical protein
MANQIFGALRRRRGRSIGVMHSNGTWIECNKDDILFTKKYLYMVKRIIAFFFLILLKRGIFIDFEPNRQSS